jgi:glyoxylase-like metal-dependent hydrolase (beta-lactamase superfamily II)
MRQGNRSRVRLSRRPRAAPGAGREKGEDGVVGNPTMSPVQVAARIYRVESRLGRRRLAQWLVIGDDGVLLFDTGVAGTVEAHVAPALAALEIDPGRLTEVVISHADVDHYGGNAEIRALAPGARISAHRLDRPLIESWEAIARQRYGWYRRHGLDYDKATWRWLEDAAGQDTRLDRQLDPGDWIDLGGIRLEVLQLPGHSLGHVGLYEPVSSTAIVADAVMGYGFDAADGGRAGPPPYVDLSAYRTTIEQLRQLLPKRLATAHFPLLEDEHVELFLDRSRDFTDRLERALDRALAEGTAPAPRALLGPVAAELGGYPEMEVELARSIGAHIETQRWLGE